MGESATAIGRGRAVGPMPASTRRPGPTGRSGSWPGVLEATSIVSSTSGAVDRESTAASMGESATAMGRGRAVGPMLASRPTGRSGLGTRVEKSQAQLPVAHNYDRKSLQRSASLSVSEPM